MVNSTPIVIRSITNHKGFKKAGGGVLSYKDVTPIAGIIMTTVQSLLQKILNLKTLKM